MHARMHGPLTLNPNPKHKGRALRAMDGTEFTSSSQGRRPRSTRKSTPSSSKVVPGRALKLTINLNIKGAPNPKHKGRALRAMDGTAFTSSSQGRRPRSTRKSTPSSSKVVPGRARAASASSRNSSAAAANARPIGVGIGSFD